MPTHSSSGDGLSQLDELMRREPAVDRPAAPPTPIVSRRRRRRRRLVGGLVALLLVGSAGGYAAYTLTAPIGLADVEADVPDVVVPAAAQIPLSPDGATAVSVAGADEYLGPDASGLLLAGGGDEPRPIASISKIVTALVVLDAKPLGAGEPGPTLTFDRDDHALYDKYYLLNATIAEMPIGSRMSLHDALEAMLIVSACNYAEAVANWAFGSQSAFLRATRDWLAANGLTGTTIVEPTGIDARNTSTPTDLLALGKLAMANPVVAEIVGMSRLEVPNIPPASNTNTLLGTEGIRGIKTGTLEGSGSNLLFSASLDVGLEHPLDVTGVVLGGYTHDSVDLDVRSLLASIRDGFHRVPLADRGQEIGVYSTPWGDSSAIVVGETASVLTWSDTAITSTFTVEPITTGDAGDPVGEITWVAGPETVTVPLLLADDIEPPSSWWRLTHPMELAG